MISSSMLPISYVVLILFFVFGDKVEHLYTVHRVRQQMRLSLSIKKI